MAALASVCGGLTVPGATDVCGTGCQGLEHVISLGRGFLCVHTCHAEVRTRGRGSCPNCPGVCLSPCSCDLMRMSHKNTVAVPDPSGYEVGEGEVFPACRNVYTRGDSVFLGSKVYTGLFCRY